MNTEVYSWRVDPAIKIALENEARREGTTISAVLDQITKSWIDSRERGSDDAAEQARLQSIVRKTIGTISGKDPRRAEQSKVRVRRRLRKRYAR